MVTPPVVASCRFGPYELDLRSGDLTRNGRRVRLQEKPRSVLIALAERPGEIVSRSELRTRLWPQDTFVDFEDGLNTAMRKLRESLSDDSRSPRYIETLRGRGYRFIAKVEVVGAAGQIGVNGAVISDGTELSGIASAAEVETLPVLAGDAGGKQSRRWLAPWTMGVAAALLCCGVGLLVGRWRDSHVQRVSLAVLPFVNMTGDGGRSYLANGMTEELIARLGGLGPEQLRVIAPASAMTYAGTPKTAQEIGRDLNVQYVVEGSLQAQGANLRVVAELVRTDDSSRVWANTYDGDASNLLDFENGVAGSVVQALELKLDSPPTSTYLPAKFEAHDAYLQGLYSLSQRSKKGFEDAMESFGKAVGADPKYAAAYSRLAVTYDLMGQYNWMDPANANSQGRAAAEQAISIDPTDAEAHAALGFSLWYYQWDRVAAEQEFRKAIGLAPQNVDAHHWYAQLLMTSGRFSEAEEQMRAALDLDPLSPILRTNLGWLHYFEGQFPQAIREMQAVVKENPNFLTAHYKLWYAYSVEGDTAQAWSEFEWVVRTITDPADQPQILKANQQGGYRSALVTLTGPGTRFYGSGVDGARCLMFAGDAAGAMRMLDQAYQKREGWMVFVAYDPAFAGLRGDPGFQRLMQSIQPMH